MYLLCLGKKNHSLGSPIHFKAYFKVKYSPMNIVGRDVGEKRTDVIYEYKIIQ